MDEKRKKIVGNLAVVIVVLIMSVMFLSGCAQLNSNPPEYVKNVAAYKEGSDGLVVYFILADASGAMTTSDGEVTLTIFETHNEFSYTTYEIINRDEELFMASLNVKKADFYKTKVGMGAFEHDAIIFSFGRIPYSAFLRKPSEMSGKVKLEFRTPDGRVLEGEETIIF